MKLPLLGGFGPLFAFLAALSVSPVDAANTVYKTQEQFLSESFSSVPAPKTLWLKGELKQNIKDLIGQNYGKLRVRYWQQGQRTAWVLEAIGKEQPITFGYLVEQGKIIDAEVLIFRESRGWEVHRPAFTKQFIGAELEQQRLSQTIDGISGATLSVRAMDKTARLALYLAEHLGS